MDPLTLLTIGSGIAEFVGAQNEATQKEALFQRNRVAANTARDLKIQSINRRLIEESEAAAEQKMAINIAALKKQERAKVAAGEAGLSGSSVDAVTSQYETQKLRDYTTINANIVNLERQIELQKIGASAEAEARIDSLPRGVQPNFLAHAVSTAASAYAVERKMTTEMPSDYTSVFGSGGYFGGDEVLLPDAAWGGGTIFIE